MKHRKRDVSKYRLPGYEGLDRSNPLGHDDLLKFVKLISDLTHSDFLKHVNWKKVGEDADRLLGKHKEIV
jgi:hypothetical protein